MKKFFDNILFLILLFLLAFIPLYPKKPLLDVVNTWVYIRAEDFVILSVLLVWISLLVRKKITLQTPLTLPVLLFWGAGALSTIHGILLIFPDLANVYPNVAFLSLIRRVEYLSLFFVAYAAVKNRQVLNYIIAVLALTLLAVSLYGIGQKYLGFPAYLTMNEEFAKGEPIRLSAMSRIPSTFAGHYDLAAYLVLVIPILASLIFAFRNWLVKLFFLGTVSLGFIVLFMTVSRVSFFVLLLSLVGVFFFHKKKWVIFSLPIVAVVFIFLFVTFSSSLLDRFGNTVKEIDVLVDARTGEALGNIKEVTPLDYQGKIVRKRFFGSSSNLDAGGVKEDSPLASASSETDPQYLMNLSLENAYLASPSGIIPYVLLPQQGVQLVQPNASTGESLPQGTGYINLALSPVRDHLNEFFYTQKKDGEVSKEVQMFSGEFLIKRASAYDLSLTTRYQGEWPHAIEAFKRNIFLGSGYGSISLAIDNNYLRILGEVGLFGLVAFLLIFITTGIYIKRVWAHVDSPIVRSFVVGFAAGVVGLALNATLIDVFEASKVAFYLWLLTGITLGMLHVYQTKQFVFFQELKKVAVSPFAIIVYLGLLTFVIFSPMLPNYFVGDDYTWLRWAAESKGWESISSYFTQADGFFYRPGTKLYFLLMYSVFWLNPLVYHITSLILHFVVVALVFLVTNKMLRDKKIAVLAAFLFALLSGYSEAVFWISSIGHVFSTLFVLLGFLLFLHWDEKKKAVYLILSLLSVGVSLLFHELGVVAPVLMVFYHYSSSDRRKSRSVVRDSHQFSTSLHGVKSSGWRARTILLLFSPVAVYLVARFLAQSHWSGGDYSYNLLKLPFNVVGNAIGYLMLSLFGPISLSIYDVLRNAAKGNLLVALIGLLVVVGGLVFVYKLVRRMSMEDQRIIVLGVGFMLISLLPFLGLGNIAPRYGYLVSFGFVILLAFCLKKIYSYLIDNGRDVAMGILVVLVSIFSLLHIIQMQQLHGDWHEGGKKVNKMFISIEGQYQDYWSTEPMKLYFVNVPIRTGDAWIFPVGLNDAMWFMFRNPKMIVNQSDSVDSALQYVTDPRLQKVFLFDNDGNVVEKLKKTPTVE